MFTKIIGKLERAEEKLDESSYPSEKSMDDFLKSVDK
jgi:hypothetical protein